MTSTNSRHLTRHDYEALSGILHVGAELIAQKLTLIKSIDSFTVNQLKEIVKYLKALPQLSSTPVAGQLKVSGNKPQLVESVKQALKYLNGDSSAAEIAASAAGGQTAQQRQTSSNPAPLPTYDATPSPQMSNSAAYGYPPNNPYAAPPAASSSSAAAASSHYANYYNQASFRPPTSQPQPPAQYASNSSSHRPMNGAPPTSMQQHTAYNQHVQQQSPYSRPGASTYVPPNSVPPHQQPQQYHLPNQHYIHSSPLTASNAYHPPASDAQNRAEAAQITNSDAYKHHGRSPFENIDQILASSVIHTYNLFNLQFSMTPSIFQRLKRSQVRPPASVPETQKVDIQLRLFNTVTQQHTTIETKNGWRIRVNNHEIQIPEAKKLNKMKQKGLELQKPLIISDYLNMYNNIISVEYVRMNYLNDPFKGCIVCEAVTEKDVTALISKIKAATPPLVLKQETRANPSSNGHVQPAPPVKACAVCGLTQADLQRCSRCKQAWYCGAKHQTEHWPAHRQTCIPVDQQKEQLAVKQEQTTTNGTTTTTLTQKPRFDVKFKPPPRPGQKQDDDVVDNDDDLLETNTSISLRCPLSIDRINCAARGRYCSHLTCFDLETYLLYSQQSTIWQCPICFGPLPYDELIIDPVTNAVLKMTSDETERVKVTPDGDWQEVGLPTTGNNDGGASKKRKAMSSTTVSSTTVSSTTNGTSSQPSARPNGNAEVVDFLADDSSSVGAENSTLSNNTFHTLPNAPYPHSMTPSPMPPSASFMPPSHTQQQRQTSQLPADDSHFSKGGSIEDAIELD